MSTTNAAQKFATLFRNSPFVTMGDFRGATVIGQVFHTSKDHLYVDIGLKFHAVAKKPQDGTFYVRGAKVRMKLLDYEITDRFIGTDQDNTLLEADAILQGLESTPVGSKQSNKS